MGRALKGGKQVFIIHLSNLSGTRVAERGCHAAAGTHVTTDSGQSLGKKRGKGEGKKQF